MQNTLLNLTPGAYSPEVHLSQYDKGRTIPFKLMDGNAEYTVPSGAVIKVKATKPSGLGFVVDCTYDGGTVTITNTETMSNEAGRFPAELSISVGDVLLGTANFIFNVERSPHPEGTTDGDAETLIPELTLLVKEIRESNAKVESMTASATALSSDANPTANYNSETNNLAFGIPTPDVTKSELLNLYIVKSASGSIASFSDGGDDLPMKSLKVNIIPKQSGTGDPSPSNVRPISGWDSVNVNVCGINLWDEEWELGYYKDGTGQKAGSLSLIRCKNKISVKPNTDYYLYVGSNQNMCVYAFDENENYLRAISYALKNTVFNTGDETAYIVFNTANTNYGTTYQNDISINYPSTDHEHHSGKDNTTYPISLGQTVYGGSLDVVSGKGQPTYHYFKPLGNENAVSDLGTFWGWVGDASQTPYGYGNGASDGVCSHFKFGTDCIVGLNASSGAYFLIYKTALPNISTLEEFKTWVANQRTNGTPLEVAYRLATPTASEFTTTPTEVKTLLGNNNIWADSGDSEAEYRADSTLAYEELSNAIISLGGNI